MGVGCNPAWSQEADIPLTRALSLAAKQGFAPDGAEIVVHGLCSRCAGGR